MFFFCVDGLPGFSEAIETIYPRAQAQLCIMHLVRASLKYVGWKQRKAVASDPRILCTTNAVESLHRSLPKATKTRGSFPDEAAALKLLFLMIGNVTKKWNFVPGWRAALNHFQILWPERMARLELR